MINDDLVLLHAGLDQAQVAGAEALESAERPLALVVLLGVLVRADLHLLAHLGLVAGLAQLLHQVVDVESGALMEESHLVQDALDVAGVSLLELPLLELVGLLGRQAQLRDALATVLAQILSGLRAEIGERL